MKEVYLFIDNFENNIKIVNEQFLRDYYNKLMDEIIFNWKDCGDNKIISDLQKEKEEVYTCDIDKVISTIMEDDKYINIERKEVQNSGKY